MGLLDLFKRGGKIAESKANASLDNMENPAEMTAQAIRDLNVKLTNAVSAQATYKAMIIQLESKQKGKEAEKVEWEQKANKLQDHVDADASKTNDIEPLIVVALENSKKCGTEADELSRNITVQNTKYHALVEEIEKLRELISTTEDHLTLLKTRQEVAAASVQVNKELSDIASTDSTKALIERMEQKVTQQEALADAYAGIDDDSATNESKINDILKEETSVSKNDLLESFRANRKK